MKIKSFQYKKNFRTSSLDPYLMETISIEVEVNDGEDATELFKTAKKQVEDWHTPMQDVIIQTEKNYPSAAVDRNDPYYFPPNESPLTQQEKLIRDINTCTEVKVLESYKLLAKKYPEIKEVYDNKLKELTK